MCFGTALSQVPSYVPTNGLVGWWPFNGNANDESGNGNNGTVNGATLTTDRFGDVGKAYSFDGVNDNISAPRNSLSQFSISLWFKTSQNASYTPFVDAHNINWELYLSNLKPTFTKWVSLPGNYQEYICSNSVSISQWNNLVCIYSSNNIDIHLNGTLVSSFSNVTLSNNSMGTYYFGASISGVIQFYNGILDDIGIWNRTLTPQEITNLYNAGPFDVSATNTTVCAGQPTTLSIQSVSGTITALNCTSTTNTGTLVAGTAASGVSSSVPYTGGNGGAHNGQTVTSTGVTGLTATLTAGTFASGNGSLTYTITGTPSASGTASFALNIGGQTCILTQSVASISSQYSSGSVFCASGPTAIVDVTNPTTGKTWMDRNLGASQVATSSTDIAAYGDLYQWGRRSDGHQCRTSATTTSLSSTDQPSNGNFILINTPNGDWRSTLNNNLWQGTNGINNPCPTGYRLPTQTEFNSEKSTWSSNSIAGAFGSPIKLPAAGGRASMIGNNGSILSAGIGGLYWTSTTSSNTSVNLSFGTVDAAFSGSNLARADGNSVRCIKEVGATVGAINCGSAVQTGVIYSGQSVIGVSISLPYTGGNGGFQLNQVYNSTGVNGLTATLSSGVIANGSGNFVLTISGTAATTGIANFALSIGGQTCNLPVNVETITAIVSSLNCATATTNGTLNSGVAASGVTTTITYTGGNGGNYASQVFSSTGVTGLNATIMAGTLANGAGNLVYTISGTPISSGTASFAVTIGGQSCTFSVPVVYNLVALYPAGSVFCPSLPTAIVEVTNPVTGRTWMDRNLGATQVATSSTDNAAYGDLYQWGRRSDGHQCRTSLTTSNLSTTDQPINSRFILGDGGDWRNPSNNNLWQGVDGINNPCPNGFKVPTETELNNERLTWLTNNSSGAFSSPLKWTMAGVRNDATGNVTQIATTGSYWTSTVIQSDQSVFLTINNSSADISNNDRAYGRSVRCIKN